jgi:hypothetical protein
MQPDAAKLKLVQSWLERAHEDLAAADRLVQEPPLSGAAAFHAQQAAARLLHRPDARRHPRDGARVTESSTRFPVAVPRRMRHQNGYSDHKYVQTD